MKPPQEQTNPIKLALLNMAANAFNPTAMHTSVSRTQISSTIPPKERKRRTRKKRLARLSRIRNRRK